MSKDCYCVECLHNIGPNPGPEGLCRGCARRIALEDVLRELVVEYESSNSEYELNIQPETIDKAKELLLLPQETP
jgi:hypothetical protein